MSGFLKFEHDSSYVINETQSVLEGLGLPPQIFRYPSKNPLGETVLIEVNSNRGEGLIQVLKQQRQVILAQLSKDGYLKEVEPDINGQIDITPFYFCYHQTQGLGVVGFIKTGAWRVAFMNNLRAPA